MVPASFLLSAGALGHALQLANGFYSPGALVWMTVSFAFALAGAGLSAAPVQTWPGKRSLTTGLTLIAVILTVWQVTALLTAVPGEFLDGHDLRLFRIGIAAEAALVGLAVLRIPRLTHLWFPILLGVHVAVGTWVLRETPDARNDVVLVHLGAFDALARGESPYDISIPNIYSADRTVYSPQLVKGDRVLIGYPYPPWSLLFEAPAHFLIGEYRYAELLAWIAAAGLIAYARPGLFPKLAATVLLTQPRGFFVLEQGWTEPISLLMLALTAVILERRPSLAHWPAGLLLVTKQSLAIVALPLWRLLWSAANGRRVLARTVLVAAAVTVPFVLWHPQSFLDNVVLLQAREPFRRESLSYLAFAVRRDWGAGSFLWAVGAALLTTMACLRLTPNTTAGFVVTVAVSMFAMFAFGSKAFCNYYFFVAGACCAAAVFTSDRTSQ